MPKRILLLYISQVSGHRSAAEAVENAIKLQEPEAEVLSIDTLDYFTPVSGKFVNFLYMGTIKHLPGIWSFLYDNPKVVKALAGYKNMVHRMNAPKLKALYDSFSPQVVACTQAFPCGIMADFKKIYNSHIPLVAILTDYVPHSFWLYDSVDYYIAPSEAIAQRLVGKGILPERIKPLGIPFDAKFNHSLEQNEIAKDFGLSTNLPTILIMGGSHGLGPLKSIVESLERMPIKVQEIIVTGVNHKLYKYLKKKEKRLRQKVLVFGYVNNIHKLMSISSLIITKPGGITTAEALAKGLPMVIINPIPGQEENNTVYLIQEGAAVRVDNPRAIGETVADLLLNAQKIESLRHAALMMSRPNAAADIARLILSLCN